MSEPGLDPKGLEAAISAMLDAFMGSGKSADIVSAAIRAYLAETRPRTEGPMSAKHTPEPWVVNGEGGDDLYSIARLYPAGVLISAVAPVLDEIENAERIVACVNALAGIENPSAVKDVIAALRRNLPAIRMYANLNDADAAEAALAKLEGLR